MEATIISPKYQVLIPKNIRKQYKIKPGERFIMIPYEGRIEMVLERDIKSMRGILKGIDTEIIREEDRS